MSPGWTSIENSRIDSRCASAKRRTCAVAKSMSRLTAAGMSRVRRSISAGGDDDVARPLVERARVIAHRRLAAAADLGQHVGRDLARRRGLGLRGFRGALQIVDGHGVSGHLRDESGVILARDARPGAEGRCPSPRAGGGVAAIDALPRGTPNFARVARSQCPLRREKRHKSRPTNPEDVSMTKFDRLPSLLAAVALGLFAHAALAQDTLKIAAGQRGNWDTSISEVGQRAGIFKKHGLVLEILWTQGGGETQQAVVSGSVDIGVAGGIMGVLSRVLERRAGAHHRRRDHRRVRPLLVRAGEFADQVAEGYRRQDDRLFDQRLVDARHRHRVHEAIRPEGEADGHRRTGADADAGDVGPDRRRLVGAAVRPAATRRRQDPHHRERQRRRRVQGPDRAPATSPTRRRCQTARR